MKGESARKGKKNMKIQGEELFIIDVPNEQFKLLYAPLRSYLAKVDYKIVELLNTSEGRDSIIRMLREKEYVDINKLHRDYSRRMPFLSIPVTDDCTLRCKYCYFRAGDKDKKTEMKKEDIKLYVDAYFNQLSDDMISEKEKYINVSIAGGGEPTKAFDTFKYTVEYIKSKAEEYGFVPRFTMPTNGFYGNEVREFIVKNFWQVSLSMDGPRDIQNYQRPAPNGGESFDVVFETAKYFKEHNLKFAFRSTVSKYSVYRMKDIIKFFNDEFPGVHIALERMSEFGRTFESGLESPSLKEFKDMIDDAHAYAYSIGAVVKNASLGKANNLRTVFCQSVAVPNWTILSDGRITSCTRDSFPEVFTFGRYNKETKQLEIDNEKLLKLRKMNVFEYEECDNCFAKYNCAGDCPNLRVAKLIDCESNRNLQLKRFLHFLENKEKGGQEDEIK